MTAIPNNKKIVILGGGTNTYISNHLALSAPAYGTTAIELAKKFKIHSENKMDVQLILTKMASSGIDCAKVRNELKDCNNEILELSSIPNRNETQEKLLQSRYPYKSRLENYLGSFEGLNPDTPEEVESIVDKLIADPDTRVIIFNVAMVDYRPEQLLEERSDWESVWNQPFKNKFGKYEGRLSTSEHPEILLEMYAADKIIQKIRKERKDILLVGFKTTCGATKEEQFLKGLKLCKDASANIVFVNDVDKNRINNLNNLLKEKENLESILPLQHSISINLSTIEKEIQALQNNGLVTPEESSYWYNTRDEALDSLVQMVVDRSHLHFTRSTVIDSETISWDSEEIPNVLRDVVNHCVAQGAYKTFTIGDSIGTKGSVGHFAYKVNETTFLTSKRKSNFNELDKIGLVKVVTDGPDHIYAYGAKPSVGGQSQRIIFDMYPHLDCILHFHSPLRQEYRNEFSIKSQFEVECGSHECGQNTAQGLNEYVLDNGQKVYAVHLDHHGPNIVFSKETDSNSLIRFVEKYFDMSKKTTGLSAELI